MGEGEGGGGVWGLGEGKQRAGEGLACAAPTDGVSRLRQVQQEKEKGGRKRGDERWGGGVSRVQYKQHAILTADQTRTAKHDGHFFAKSKSCNHCAPFDSRNLR